MNLVGSSIPKAREVDSATMAASSLFVDRRESTLNEAGDYILAAREGAIGPEQIRAEIGEVLKGEKPGRTSPEEITLFKSLAWPLRTLHPQNIYTERQGDRMPAPGLSFHHRNALNSDIA